MIGESDRGRSRRRPLPDRADAKAEPHRRDAVVLALVAGFIVYGSLFPFAYVDRSYPGGAVAYLLSTRLDWDGRGDLLSNILLYIPFGFFATCALPSRMAGPGRALLATIAGAALSCGMETAQFHDAERVTSMGDVYANTIGSGAGALAAAAFGAAVRFPFVREPAERPAETMLLVMFFGYRLYPYVPTIDLHKYWHAVQPVLLSPTLSVHDLARYAIAWLLVAAITDALYGFRRFMFLFPLLCGLEFLGKILIVGTALQLPDLAGAGIAYLIWILVPRSAPGRSSFLALAFGCMVAAQRLQPFEFAGPAHVFGWVPFASMMQGSIGVAMQAFCEKFYQYGGLIWLLGRAGMPLPVGTAALGTLLFATSIAECWLVGRSAEITDAVMALTIGAALSLLRGRTGEHAPIERAAALDAVPLANAVLAQHDRGME